MSIGDSGAAACPACRGPLSSWTTVPASEPALAGQRYELLRCGRCGSAVTLGAGGPELHEHGAYRPGTPRLYGLANPLLGAFERQRLAWVRELASPPARLLDAGAGRGRFLAAAAAAGYDAHGIEPSDRGIVAVREKRLDVRQATIEDAEIDERSVDIVTLWHVLEHVEHPAVALRRIHDWLRPDGGLIVGVPNLDSWQARLGGPRWYHLDVPRHRSHFTPAGITILLMESGFEPVRTRHMVAEQNLFGMWQTLVNRLTRHPSYAYNALKRNAPLRSTDLAITGLAMPVALPAAVLELLAAASGHGGTIAVTARRSG